MGADVPATFRDQTIAAPLKRGGDKANQITSGLFPRSNDRGSIEATSDRS